MANDLLVINNLHSFYGMSHVLHGVDFTVQRGDAIALMGRNGMGKTTLLKSIMGLIRPRQGRVEFQGIDISGMPPYEIARSGIGYVPERRGIFRNLSTLENLLMSARKGYLGRHDWTLDRVLMTFPSLNGRLNHGGGDLSGGEQQMLSIGRALMTNPDLLLLDEATEGLAPSVAHEIWNAIDVVRKTGVAVVIVDKNSFSLAAGATRTTILVKGLVVFDGPSAELRVRSDLQRQYLGL